MENWEDAQGVTAHVEREVTQKRQCSDIVGDALMVPCAVVAIHNLSAEVVVHRTRARESKAELDIRSPMKPHKKPSLSHKRLRRIPFMANSDLDYIIGRSRYLKTIWCDDDDDDAEKEIILQHPSRSTANQRRGMKRKAIHMVDIDDAVANDSPTCRQCDAHRNKKARTVDSPGVRRLSRKFSGMSLNSQKARDTRETFS